MVGRHAIFGHIWAPLIASPFGLAWSNNAVGSTFGYRSGDYGPDGRINNAVMYFSPVMAGLEMGVGYSFSTEDVQHSGNANNNRVLTAGLRYTNGPLQAALTYDQLYAKQHTNLRNSQNYQVAVSYDFGFMEAVYRV